MADSFLRLESGLAIPGNISTDAVGAAHQFAIAMTGGAHVAGHGLANLDHQATADLTNVCMEATAGAANGESSSGITT